MDKILDGSLFIIAILFSVIKVSKSVMNSNLKEFSKIIILAVTNFVIYCLLQYSYGFIQWTIRINTFYKYPYRNLFCMLVICYCLISFVTLGAYYIKYIKDKYGVVGGVWLLVAIHILAIVLLLLFSPFNHFF